MGILNITPDSFSDGGRLLDPSGRANLDLVEEAAVRMIAQGARILDVGGESTRPGAADVSLEAELARVIPVMERLSQLDTLLSIDTRKSGVATAALAAGCHMVNDVTAGAEAATLSAVANAGAGLCLMHMRGEPGTMQQGPVYADVLADVAGYLRDRVEKAVSAGVPRECVVVDPGIGFGKTVQHNLRLLANLDRLVALGLPVLVGVSRKSFLGQITGRPLHDRDAASVSMALLAVDRGARIVRTHDVAATREGLLLWDALEDQREVSQTSA